jgi:hypothetical protein
MNERIDSESYLGINESKIYELCLEIDNFKDNLATILGNIDDNMNDVSKFYESSAATSLLNSYNEFRKNYPIIKDNVDSYAEDLKELVVKYKSGAKSIALSFDNQSSDIKTQAKTIDYKEV